MEEKEIIICKLEKNKNQKDPAAAIKLNEYSIKRCSKYENSIEI